MVREARVAWDDEEYRLGRPHRRTTFDEGDGPDLDPYLSKKLAKSNRARRRKQPKHKSARRNDPDPKPGKQE